MKTGPFVGAALCATLFSGLVLGAGPDTRLLEAARRSDVGAVQALIGQGVDVNVAQPDGATALHWAAYRDNLEIADLLIRAGASVDVEEDGGVTPLAVAAANASAELVDRLLGAGADPNRGRETAVMAAAQSGSAEVMKHLLARGGDPNTKEPLRGQTALMWAVAESHAGVARVLVEAGADVRARTFVVRSQRRGEAGNGANGFTPLLFAIRAGDLPSVRLLVQAGANVDGPAADGMSPLVLATVRAHPAVAMYLLEQGADPNAAGTGFTALHWASGSWETELTVTSITPDREGEEWLTVAGLRDHRLELVKALLARGADPNARIRRTPDRVGSSKNPSLPELEGATPFIVAAVGGQVEVMKVLAAQGADVHLRTNHQGTALMAAAGLGRAIGEVLVPEADTLAAARLILELGGAEVNAVDTIGNSALHYAAFMRRDSIVQLLAERGAELNKPNLYGETPLFLSELVIQFAGGGRVESGQTSTGELLRKLGAQRGRPAYILRPHYWPSIPHV